LLVATGRGEEAADLLGQAENPGPTPYLYLIQATVSPALDSLASGMADVATTDIFGPGLERMTVVSGWAVAAWHAAKGHRSELVRFTERLNLLASEDPNSARKEWLSRAVQGHLAALNGDRTGAIEAFASLRPEYPHKSMNWGHYTVLPYERLCLAELYLATGQYHMALEAAELFDHPGPAMFLPFLPRSLVVRAAAAEALGSHNQAEESRRRLARLGREDLLGESRRPQDDPTLSP
jgi:hypothetical protein